MNILAIESSCDDTSAAVLTDGSLKSNIIASQKIHALYGGVVPELASRAHQQNIVPVVSVALKEAGTGVHELDAIAYTRGPGLLGSLLVGVSFAKGLALGANVPLIEVNHLEGHVMATFLTDDKPQFPYMCLLVSGGNSQVVKVVDYNHFEVLGQTIDDAAGEAFDKCGKMMGLPYPCGAIIDQLASQGNAQAFTFAKPHVPHYDYSFSGLKTSFLYFLRDQLKTTPDFIELHKADLCASLQRTIIEILLEKFERACIAEGVREIAVGGGVSANSGLRAALVALGKKYGWHVHIPPFQFTTDNAAMIGIAGYYKYLAHQFGDIEAVPFTKN